MEAVENLLEKVDALRFKYDVLNDLEKGSFNVFSVLFKENDEVRLHSRFIAELLNPCGRHGKGGTFLRLFLEHIPGSDALVDVADSCSVEREVSGIDILIRYRRKAVILENKIHARDQERQLERYFVYVRDELKVPEDEMRVVYLSLDGRGPSDNSVGKLGRKKIDCVSYKSQILEWLDGCIKESTQDSALKESLVQYQRLVRTIAGNEEYMDKIKQLLLGDVECFQSASNIEKVMPKVRADLEHRFWVALERELEGRFPGKIEGDYRNKVNRKDYGIKVSLGLNDWEVDCCYYFEMDDGQRICQGFWYEHTYDIGEETKERYPEKEIQRLRDAIRPIADDLPGSSPWWFWYKRLDVDFKSFDKESINKIFTDERLNAYVGKLVDDAERHIKAFEAGIASAASN